MMISILWWLFRIAFISILVAVLVAQEGNTEIVWLGWKANIPTSLLIGSFIIAISIILWVNNIWKMIINFPYQISKSIKDRKQKKGYQALAYGLVASSAGDVEGAEKYASQAERLLENRDLTEMLSAHAAHLSGNKSAARQYFKRLSSRKTTSFHGHLGLMRLASEELQSDDALYHARKASFLQPRNPKLTSILVKMEARKENFPEAIEALHRARRIGAIDEKEAQSIGVALHTAMGFLNIEKKQTDEAQKSFSYALRENSNFIPAVTALSKIYLSQGSNKKALNLLIKTWKSKPHPDIANALKLIWNDTRSSITVSKLIDITDADASSEARLFIANEALSSGLTGEAEGQLNKITEDEHNVFYYQLKSRIAKNNNNTNEVSLALEKAFSAPRKNSWNCNNCGLTSERWSSKCMRCNSIGTLNWQTPPELAKIEHSKS